MVNEPCGNKRLNALFALPGPIDGQQPRSPQRSPLSLRDRWPDDDVHSAGLIFQRREDRAARSTRLLSVRHDATGDHLVPVASVCSQVLNRAHAELGELRSNQRERMAAQCEAHRGIVVRDLGALLRRGERHSVFVRARSPQHLSRPRVDADGLPYGIGR